MADRPLRADARRNREQILTAATGAFAERGPATSLEDIAREAGVGIGTLYRHFPTRDALFVAVHRAEIVRIAERGDELLASHEPRLALEGWLVEFLEFMHSKRGMAEVFRSVMSSGENPFLDLRAETTAAAERLLRAAREDGAAVEIDAFDLLTTLHGISLATDDPDRTARLLRFLAHSLTGKYN
ncbi:TetR/AcrR family transcriptional regulator [Amnibacterium sp.]|uniref:TetR/AcrR family transcriptional regulator n=1 Tax=Amnibacterium sp. TaxID=1872496 RepID=UPI0026397E48|nr:TetR/AcrR family transcriptional regulator [Amnibacterium sp.]MCU1474471.1 TetR family transcriptional regulator [Amnibacterium sp.]